jgi:hypothetical protein
MVAMRFGNFMLPFINRPWKEKAGFSALGVAATLTDRPGSSNRKRRTMNLTTVEAGTSED